MATNHNMELIIATLYPRSMKHLQQLIMDADVCAKSIGMKTWLGKDKLPSKVLALERTAVRCAIALEEDGQLSNSRDARQSFAAINRALGMLSQTYSSWPMAFEFWDAYYSGVLDE